MSDAASALAGARAAHRGLRWDDAYAGFLAVTAPEGLAVEDLEMLAECAQLSGRHEAAVSALDRAFALARADLGPEAALRYFDGSALPKAGATAPRLPSRATSPGA